ncbi:DUF3718 domain-containing protein [Alteromonas sp. C1M14]|uniref:DUF3718 domain-containing protein n=1 Tax=Alteromonas sp. C1M14 TaxID=2841567 RepID=UPI001C082B5F|nr:DUF3718 domain-containing protein [Alteromonas sp. C1M14]MBU2979298.1 DUF3718 domain-containing protein [Alteromonas sp. C1M14]
MKLSTFALALTLSVSSVQAFAQNVILKPVNDNLETQACLTAAQEGFTAARKLVRQQGVAFSEFAASVSCNGMSLRAFSDQYSSHTVTAHSSVIALVAKDEDAASQACIDATRMGADKALEKHNLQGEAIICNHRDITAFARQYQTDNVIVRAAAEE